MLSFSSKDPQVLLLRAASTEDSYRRSAVIPLACTIVTGCSEAELPFEK